ncbi:MAG: hypothetical protein AAFV86_14005 [Pseudomonadota bacterium]
MSGSPGPAPLTRPPDPPLWPAPIVHPHGAVAAPGAGVDPALAGEAVRRALLCLAAGFGLAIPAIAVAARFARRIRRVEHDSRTSLLASLLVSVVASVFASEAAPGAAPFPPALPA